MPDAPINVRVERTANGYRITSQDPPGETEPILGRKFERSLDGGITWAQIAGNVQVTSYDDEEDIPQLEFRRTPRPKAGLMRVTT